ncbi:MAG: divalent-cation tolerance protein CutA [Magnetococcales bacterium]|nr:divalent-cation tolerance protein CutA [Magnetococcales bacterium]
MELARELVNSKLAACVHVLAQGESVYVWEGAVQTEAEWTVLIKTRTAIYQELESRIKAIHPYDLPEIIATKIVQGEPNYLNWLCQSTKQSTVY